MFEQNVFRKGMLFVLCTWCSCATAIDVSFNDVTTERGLDYIGVSFGASWGDFNRDGNPDLYLSNHWGSTAIYENNGGTFSNISSTVIGSLEGDVHAGAWGDFDNDGDQDLAITVGAQFGSGSEFNRLLENTGSGFIEKAGPLGVQLGEGRGRTPLWFDWNNDGKLDLLFTNEPRFDGLAPTTLFTQTKTSFENSNSDVGLSVEGSTRYSTLISQGPTDPPLLLIQNKWPFPAALYDYSNAPFIDVQDSLGPTSVPAPIFDIATGDFDNDQQTEIYLTRVAAPMVARNSTTHQARAYLIGEATANYGFSFVASGQIQISVGPGWVIESSNIKIGEPGVSPPSSVFTLNSNDGSSWGAFSGDPSTAGLFVHYDPSVERWFVQLRDSRIIVMAVDSVNPLTDIQSIGLPDESSLLEHVYLDQVGGQFVDAADAAGLNIPRACRHTATADFDNDMDLDIYLVCTDQAGNLPNQLLENDGSGFFTNVVDAAGATGPVLGVGGVVAIADFDSDGFMDIFLANGAGAPPLSYDGPSQLYRNSGNENHWLAIELTGVVSNRDGIGATVIVEANGVQQYRLQDGGMHWYAQNHTRVHFGLAENESVDRIEVRWPSGIVQVLQDIASNQVLQIDETAAVDSDGDAVLDSVDNCLTLPNPTQTDSNTDGFGNACDADVNNDCIVNFQDIALFFAAFLSNDADNDFNDDGIVNFIDFSNMALAFLQQPGPSALANCTD